MYTHYWNGYDPYYMKEMPKPPMPEPLPIPEPPMPIVCPQPEIDYYTYPANLDEALRMIEEAVMGETSDAKFYEAMIKLCDKEKKAVFESIIADEHKHAQLFRTIYCEITGHVLPEAPTGEVKMPKTCCEGLQEAFYEELATADKYKRILYAMQNRRHINMIVEAITDEQKHAQKLNHLFCMNCCCEHHQHKPKK